MMTMPTPMQTPRGEMKSLAKMISWVVGEVVFDLLMMFFWVFEVDEK